MDISGLTNNILTNANEKANSTNAKNLSSNVNGLSSESSDEELMNAIKDFESYFMEKIMKEVKDTMTKWGDDEKSDPMDQLSDFYMDKVYEELADKALDDIGGNFTQQLFEQMKRNYNIPAATSEDVSE